MVARSPIRTTAGSSAAFRRDGARIVTAARAMVRCVSGTPSRERPSRPPYEARGGDVDGGIQSRRRVESLPPARIGPFGYGGPRGAEMLWSCTAIPWEVTQLAFSADGRRLGSVSDDGTVRIWEADPRASLPVLRGHTRYVYPVAFSPDGQWIASGSWDGTVRLLGCPDGRRGALRRPPGASAKTWPGSPDSSWLVSRGRRRWSAPALGRVATGLRWKEIQGPGNRIVSVAVSRTVP